MGFSNKPLCSRGERLSTPLIWLQLLLFQAPFQQTPVSHA